MRKILYILIFGFISFSKALTAQTLPFKENLKWGIKENETIIIKPLYDTVFNFDATGKVCLACYKSKGLSANRFIRTYTTVYACNYFNKQGQRLIIKTEDGDTSSVFSLGKLTVKQFNDDLSNFSVSSKTKKYLVDKSFKQITFKGYNEIYVTPEPTLVCTELKNEGGVVSTGLINLNEEQIVPTRYSGIKVNPKDSLIVACSAGMGGSGADDIYDYSGKKIASYMRHTDMATKHFVVHKIFEPKEYYILLNVKTKQETNFNADEIIPFSSDEILLRSKNEWFTFNLESKQKKPYKK